MEFGRTCSVLESGIEDGLHLGGQLYVSRRGRPLIDSAFGRLDEERQTTVDSLLLWRSAGKPVTAIAIAQLVERRLLMWDQTVTSIIPEFVEGGKAHITIRHILTHTRGFQTADRIAEDLSWVERVNAICGTPINEGWHPGKQAAYQTWSGWQILAEIVQRITGSTFIDHVSDSVLEPAGMNRTRIGIPESELADIAHSVPPFYRSLRGVLSPHETLNSGPSVTDCRPGTNMRGPANEVGRFYEALLGVERSPLITPETLTYITRRHREGLFDHTFQHVIDFGMGFVLNSNRHGIDTVPYGYGPFASDEAFGHSGAQCSCAFADPARDLVVAWVVNGAPNEPRHQKRARAINTAIYEDLGLAD